MAEAKEEKVFHLKYSELKAFEMEAKDRYKPDKWVVFFDRLIAVAIGAGIMAFIFWLLFKDYVFVDVIRLYV